ncbi:hypothetical protein INS49_015746 [Diaporthe citri]|uniref:uncharacterized protein n=1 Tax=Diaporthe citri TaxID=83186 RepID=UPI001C80D0B4|nr:uncharacterized protein INS49_015746 [Diaporthe citri]KAG6356358.1 hypothetical protein INS49_015746 [Diaporthe citri]
MSANDNGGPEDFVFIDDPMQAESLDDGLSGSNASNSPVEPDYVTVDSDDQIISANRDILVEPTSDKYKQAIVKIEYFEPMRLSAFPDELTEAALMTPIPSEYQALEDELRRPPSPTKPHSVLVTNANLLLECFFHFEGLYLKIGRGPVLCVVGKACGLSSKRARTLQQHVGCTFDALREGRMAFLRRTIGTFIPRAEDHNVRELARLVGYINFKSEEQQEVEERWYKDPAFEKMWSEWQEILENKGLRITEGQKKTASDQNSGSTSGELNSLVSKAVRAADRLDDYMMHLDACGGLRSGGLTKDDRLLLQRALGKATRWTGRIKDSH